MNDAPSLVQIVAAVLGLVAFAVAMRRAVRRRIDQAVAVARAEGEAALARSEGELRARLVEAETRLDEERRQGAEKLRLLEEAERKLEDAFAGLASRALAANNDSFLTLAQQAFEKLQAGSQGDLEQRRQAIETLLAPMREQLVRYESGVRELEKSREQAYGTLSEQLRGLAASQEGLVRETGRLVTALRRPEVRGNWGEVQLRRTVEFAGMVEYVDFVPQVSVDGDEGRLRPDLVVRLPGGKQVVVDAKAPLDAYLAAVEARDEGSRAEALARHARQVRSHLAKLSEKAYWKQFEEAPEFVVLFLPGDAFFAAALEQAPELIEEAFQQNVLITTPSTLVALLKTVHYGWRQETIARNARQIHDEAVTFYDRVRVFVEHFGRIGKGLDDSLKAYNAAVSSYERNVLSQGRRLERLAATIDKPLAEPRPLDAAPRHLAADDPRD